MHLEEVGCDSGDKTQLAKDRMTSRRTFLKSQIISVVTIRPAADRTVIFPQLKQYTNWQHYLLLFKSSSIT